MKPQHRTRAILKSGLEASQKIILVAISDHMEDTEEGPDRNARPSVDLLCAETGLSERTLRKTVCAGIEIDRESKHDALADALWGARLVQEMHRQKGGILC